VAGFTIGSLQLIPWPTPPGAAVQCLHALLVTWRPHRQRGVGGECQEQSRRRMARP